MVGGQAPIFFLKEKGGRVSLTLSLFGLKLKSIDGKVVLLYDEIKINKIKKERR
jgi:hypothetical protein